MAQVLRLSSPHQLRERTATPRTVTIDGEPVRLFVDRLTVGELDAVEACDYPRGSSPVDADRQDAGQLARIGAIDRHLQALPGEILLDGGPAGFLGSLFGARADIVATLYSALLEAQSPSAAEREALSVAVRFSAYLAENPPSDWAKTGTDCGKCHELKLCAKRHCDGSTSKRLVWHGAPLRSLESGGPLRLYTCPVLSFTPETSRLLRLFSWTHELAIEGPGVLRYRRVGLPVGGGLGDQEAWTMTALAVVRQEQNDILAERTPKTPEASRG